MDTLFSNDLVKENNLLKRFEEIHNFIYANDSLSSQQTLEEFIKILFIKIFDENNKTNLFQIDSNEFNSIHYSSSLNSFLKRIEVLFNKTKLEYSDLFESNDKINISSQSLGFIVNKLQNILLSDSSQDVNGLAFQKFLSHHEKESRGQFFTPSVVVDLCVEIINPKLDELLIDPACGSGSFLLSSLNHIKKNNSNVNISNLISNNLFGIDINKSVSRIARMRLLLEANVKSNIYCRNSLMDIDLLKLDLISKSFKNFSGFDIVLTNPPFGTAGKINDINILSNFDLGYKWSLHNNNYYNSKVLNKGQVAEILFIERCIQLLKPGGRMGIVLPNGNFENPSLDYLRFFIKQKAKILAIINLPSDTFIPYGTGMKTSVLFLEKYFNDSKTSYPIFFGKVNKLGYQGNKNGSPIYKKNSFGEIEKDNFKNPIIDEDYSTIIQDFKIFKEQKEIKSPNSFSINSNELESRLDYDFYSPNNRQLLNILKNKNSVQLKELVSIVKSKSQKLNNKNLLVEYVELSDINTQSFEIINSTTYSVHNLPSRASYDIFSGDIITAIAGNSVGTKKHATALVSDEFNECICTNGFRVFRDFKIDKYYLLFMLKSEYFLKQMYLFRTGAAIPNVSDKDLGNILIYIPDENKIKTISEKVQKSFDLRRASKIELENILL